MTIPTLITLLSLTLNPTDGLAPLQTTAVISVDKSIAGGMVCLIWVPDPAETRGGRSHIDCWPILPGIRSWTRALTLESIGVWSVWAQVMGIDYKSKEVVYLTPVIDGVTK